MESINLIGSEEVRNAGQQMSEAAESIRRAASAIDESLARQQIFMDDWLGRLQSLIEGDRTKSLETQVETLKEKVNQAHRDWKERCAMNGSCYLAGEVNKDEETS